MFQDTLRVILKNIQSSDRPLTTKKLLEQLRGPFKVPEARLLEMLDELVRDGLIFEWPPLRSKKRYWREDPESYLGSAVLKELSRGSATRSELGKRLRKHLFQTPKKGSEELTRKCLNRLLGEGRLYKHPKAGRSGVRYGTQPPDPSPYLSRVRIELRKVCEKLAPVGVSAREVHEALLSEISPQGVEAAGERPVRSATESPIPADPGRVLLEKALEIEPAAARQALVSLRKLRDAARMSPGLFDRTVLQLAEEGKVWLHRHAYPAEADEDEIVRDDKGNCFMGLVIRP